MQTSARRNALTAMLIQTAQSQPESPSRTNSISTGADFLTHLASLSVCCSPDELRMLFKRMHLALEDNWIVLRGSPSLGLVTDWINDDLAATADEIQCEKMACRRLNGKSTSNSSPDDFQDTQSSDEGCDIPLPMPPRVSVRSHHRP